jgi:hypothetical protein
MANGDMGVIRKAILERGYTIQRGGSGTVGGHEKVYDPEGNFLMPLPGTPGDRRSTKNTVAQLRRLGVLKHDPFGAKPTTKKRRGPRGAKPPPAPPPASELRRRDLHDLLITGMEQFVTRIAGGWGRSTDIALAGVAWMGVQGTPGRPLSVEYAEQQLTKLCGGAMLPLVEEQAWQAFLDEINEDSDPLLRWIEILRGTRGL